MTGIEATLLTAVIFVFVLLWKLDSRISARISLAEKDVESLRIEVNDCARDQFNQLGVAPPGMRQMNLIEQAQAAPRKNTQEATFQMIADILGESSHPMAVQTVYRKLNRLKRKPIAVDTVGSYLAKMTRSADWPVMRVAPGHYALTVEVNSD